MQKVIIAANYMSDYLSAVIGSGEKYGVRMIVSQEKEPLGTCGPLTLIAEHLGEPFFMMNGDILTDIDLQLLIDEHFRCGNDVTLALRKTGLAAAVAFRDGRVLDIGKRYGMPGSYDFANIAVWNPEVFRRIPANQKISFIPILGDWIGKGGKIGGIVLNERKWFNISSRSDYLDVHRIISKEHWKPHYLKEPQWPEQVAASAQRLSSIGAECTSFIMFAVPIFKDAYFGPTRCVKQSQGPIH